MHILTDNIRFSDAALMKKHDFIMECINFYTQAQEGSYAYEEYQKRKAPHDLMVELFVFYFMHAEITI